MFHSWQLLTVLLFIIISTMHCKETPDYAPCKTSKFQTQTKSLEADRGLSQGVQNPWGPIVRENDTTGEILADIAQILWWIFFFPH